MKFVKLGFAYSCWAAFDDAGDDASDGVALALYLSDESFHLCSFLCIRTAYGILFCQRQVVLAVVLIQADVAYLRRIGLNRDSKFTECQFR